MKKTLGGDRLGSGKRMKVELHGYERSTHDLSYIFRSTMAAGTLVPFMSELALPGDTFDIELDCDVKTHPTIGPLFGSFKVQLDIFEAPLRLYQGQLHNNKLGIGMNMANIKLPLILLTMPTLATTVEPPDIDNSQINPSCILAYLGIRGTGLNNTGAPVPRSFNGVPYLAYHEIYKNYYANKQEEIGAVLHKLPPVLITTVDEISIVIPNSSGVIPQEPAVGSGALPISTQGLIRISFTGTQPDISQIMLNTTSGRLAISETTISPTEIIQNDLIVRTDNPATNGYNPISWGYITPQEMRFTVPEIVTFPLSNIDTMRERILAYATEGAAPFVINQTTNPLAPYSYALSNNAEGVPATLVTQEGLLLKTYQSDLFNNWLQTEWIDGAGGISEVTAISTLTGSFTIDTLNLSKKVYDMLNRIAVSGGSYDDWLDAVYAHDRYTRCESPIYHGGLIKELVFQEVVSNSAAPTSDGDQPLGTLAGKGIMAKKHKGGKITIKVSEPSYLIGIVSLTPRIDYSQGNKWDTRLETMDDLHKPALDEIGFQELITDQMAWWDTKWNGTEWVHQSAGKQPAWMNYMTNVNRTFGNFAIENNEMFMTLNRRYEFQLDGRTIKDLTTYIDPSKYNFIFAQTALDAQNFWTQIGVQMIARRKMSAKIMPNL